MDSNDDSHHSLCLPFLFFPPKGRRDHRLRLLFALFPILVALCGVDRRHRVVYNLPHVADVVSARQIACATQKLGCGMWISNYSSYGTELQTASIASGLWGDGVHIVDRMDWAC